MADKARNPDRKNHKAWSKDHNPTVEQVQQAQNRAVKSAERRHAREMRSTPSGGGSPLTFPDVNWGWFQHAMVSRWPNTRKVRAIDAVVAQGKNKGKPDDGIPLVVEVSPEERRKSKNGR